MYKVVYLPVARQQLTNAALNIASEVNAPNAAGSLLDEADAQAARLCEFPYRYPVYPLPFAMKHELRSFTLKNYRVFYVVREDKKTVEIWRLLHRLQEPDPS